MSESDTIAAVEAKPWPELDPGALFGNAGEIVSALDPVTEADRAAVLAQLLTAFGSIVGRRPYLWLDGAKHYPALYVCIVGRTSKARKGTSWNRVGEIVERVDRNWFDDRVFTGLSSGEGLVWEVRDSVSEHVPKSGKREEDDDDPSRYVERIVDPGVDDKRMLVIEGEFSSVLRVMRREGNTLSQYLRNLWDNGNAGGMTKNSRTRTRRAHVSLVAHITVEELTREMGSLDFYNGFANRFLFVCAARSKMLPSGGALDDLTLDNFGFALAVLAREAPDRRMTFDFDAETVWNTAYNGELAEEHSGAVGGVLARGEPMVARLSILYALLDHSTVIFPEHVNAALCLWRYCRDSALYLFGTVEQNRQARIVAALRHAPDRLTRTDLYGLFKRHITAKQLDADLMALLRRGVIVKTEEPTAGRPVTRYRLAGHAN